MLSLRIPAVMMALSVALTAGRAKPVATSALKVEPIEGYFGTPQIAAPAVAPDGMHVAFLAPVANRMSVVVFDLATAKVEPIARAFDADITEFFWKGNDRIVFSADPNGRESRAYFVIDLKTKSPRVLAENWRENRPDAAYANLVDWLPFDPTHILVYGRSSEGGWHEGLFRINLITGDRDAVFGSDPETDEWHPDCSGSVRFRWRHYANQIAIETRADDNALWKTAAEINGDFTSYYSPIVYHGFSANGRTVYLSRADEQGHGSLYAYDVATGSWGDPLFTSDTEITGVRLSPKHDRVLSVQYGPDGRDEKWLDPRMEKIAQSLRASFPKNVSVLIGNSDLEEKVFVIGVDSDVSPRAYYLLDLRGKPQLVELGKSHPELTPDKLRPMRPITYTARDGLVIHGYLTLPAGAAGKHVPLILNPHGGPYGIRDEWGFNPEVQFLASRGYAVLQPNYRGSGGYGTQFYLAGRHEWGRKMQDDLTDAVKWAIDQGIADPKRVCIYGASYGGYAALAGAVFTPDLYCCAVNYVGVSDLGLISNWQHEMSAVTETYYKDMIGDDKAFIENYSPVNFVERIKIPTLHAYGENDPRVKIRNWTELERELKKYHKIYDYVHEENEGHGFHNESARMHFYRELETFLNKYLAPSGQQLTQE